MSDDVSNEEVDAVEFMRIDDLDISQHPKLLVALHVLAVHGTGPDVDAAADALTRIAAKAMVRRK